MIQKGVEASSCVSTSSGFTSAGNNNVSVNTGGIEKIKLAWNEQ